MIVNLAAYFILSASMNLYQSLNNHVVYIKADKVKILTIPDKEAKSHD